MYCLKLNLIFLKIIIYKFFFFTFLLYRVGYNRPGSVIFGTGRVRFRFRVPDSLNGFGSGTGHSEPVWTRLQPYTSATEGGGRERAGADACPDRHGQPQAKSFIVKHTLHRQPEVTLGNNMHARRIRSQAPHSCTLRTLGVVQERGATATRRPPKEARKHDARIDRHREPASEVFHLQAHHPSATHRRPNAARRQP